MNGMKTDSPHENQIDRAIDWDDAFANSAYIPGSDALPALWAADAASYRDSGRRIDLDVIYGTAPRACFDLIWPDTTPKGLAVFVHGGYWMILDKSSWTHFAEGARANGWAVCIPSYTLAPDARIAEITRQLATAITKAAQMVAGPIALAGHSAGGQLVARMVCEDQKTTYTARTQPVHTLCISGVHDLRPLMHTKMNATLHIDAEEAALESPALLRPAAGAAVTTWVGGHERPEFLRQSRLLTDAWGARSVVDRTHDHFSVLNGLRDPDSAITRAFIAAP